MFESIMNLFKKLNKKEKKATINSKEAAKERLHLVLMQDRANVSADFLELMKQEIIDVIKKYIEVDEKEIDVRLTNKENEDGTNGAPALYANIPILNIKNDARKIGKKEVEEKESSKQESSENKEEKTKDKEVKKEKTEKSEKSAESKEDNKIENNKEEDEKIKEEKAEEKKENNEEEQKEIEAQEKIKEIIDGVIEEAENNKNEKIKS